MEKLTGTFAKRLAQEFPKWQVRILGVILLILSLLTVSIFHFCLLVEQSPLLKEIVTIVAFFTSKITFFFFIFFFSFQIYDVTQLVLDHKF